MKNRITYIDGLKGLCGILVSLYHFFLVAYNAGYVGFGTDFSASEAVNQILKNPLSAFLCNNCVGLYIFLVLIAVFPIISFRKKNSKPEIMGRYACKRYFQLLPLCFITSIIMVLFYNGGLLHFEDLSVLVNHPWPSSTNPDYSNILIACKVMLFDAWFSSTREVGSLWCLYIIFTGSLAVYAAYGLFGNSKWKYLPSCALFILTLWDANYCVFAFGSILGEIMAEDKKKELSLPLSLLLIIIGILIVKIPNNLYPLTFSAFVNGAVGSFIIILAIINSPELRNLFSNKILVFLGRISFELIISHIFILGTVSYYILKWLMNFMSLGFCSAIILGVSSTIISLPLAYLLNKWLAPVSKKLTSFIEKKCFGTK